MPVDPKARALLDQMQASGFPPLNTLSPDAAREAAVALRAMNGPPEAVARVDHHTVPGPAGDVPVRVYTPFGTAPFPVLVYLHGGGWVIGDLDTHDGVCRALANAAGCLVVAVHYRRAPEHKFPAAAEDAYAATAWVAEHALRIGADPTRIAIGGDSAGGNLAAVVALMARDRKRPPLRFQLLVYPVTDSSCDSVSYRENADGYFLTKDLMLWFWNHYLRADADRLHPYAAPVHARDLQGLPPALVITAEFDPLRDEGEAYAARLQRAGIATTLTRYDGMIHGFFGMANLFDQAQTAIAESAAALRGAFLTPA